MASSGSSTADTVPPGTAGLPSPYLDPAAPGAADLLATAMAYVDELLVAAARDTHRAIARRVFGAVGLMTLGTARLPQAFHDGISATAYASVSLGLQGAAAGLSWAGAHALGPRLDDAAALRGLQSALAGVVGERPAKGRADLAPQMSLRSGGRVVLPTREALAEAYPDAGGRLLVFLHGLAGHEGHWARRVSGADSTYASRLEQRGGWTPLFLRTNTGLPVAENGAALDDLLQRVVDEWPCAVRRVALVGHSMGGLLARSACCAAQEREAPWTERLTDLVTLGTPHLGADLAVAALHGARLTALVPELAALGRLLDQRSPGIRDLERGLPAVLPLSHVKYRLVSAGVGGPGGAWDRLLGDLLVRRGSATGTGRALPLFPEATMLHVPNADHMALLSHAEVLTALEEWLA